MDLGYKIKKLREARKYSQQDIADFLNISQKTFSNYESCKSTPSLQQLCQLSQILDFDLLEYIKESRMNFNSTIINGSEKNLFLNNSNNSRIRTMLNLQISNYKALLQSKDDIIELLKQKIEWLQKK